MEPIERIPLVVVAKPSFDLPLAMLVTVPGVTGLFCSMAGDAKLVLTALVLFVTTFLDAVTFDDDSGRFATIMLPSCLLRSSQFWSSFSLIQQTVSYEISRHSSSPSSHCTNTSCLSSSFTCLSTVHGRYL